MSTRAWSDNRTREVITLQVAEQINQGADGRISAPRSARRDIIHIGKIPISRTNIGIFPISLASVIRKCPRVRHLRLSQFLLNRP
jgi:hypothetical protein